MTYVPPHGREGQAVAARQSGRPGQLVLDPVSRQDAGVWTCLAENSQGLGESGPLELQVEHAPDCLAGPATLSLAVHESVDLECAVAARSALLQLVQLTVMHSLCSPANVSFVWSASLGGSQLAVASSQFTQVCRYKY